MSEAAPELHHHGSSVCAAKVRLALAEKGVAWTGHYVDILAGEQFAPEFLALNPRAAVPVLVHRGAAVTESTVICEYVDQAFAGPALRPADALGQARMRMWTKRVDEEAHPAVRPLTYVVTHRNAILSRGPAAVEEHIASDPHPAGARASGAGSSRASTRRTSRRRSAPSGGWSATWTMRCPRRTGLRARAGHSPTAR